MSQYGEATSEVLNDFGVETNSQGGGSETKKHGYTDDGESLADIRVEEQVPKKVKKEQNSESRSGNIGVGKGRRKYDALRIDGMVENDGRKRKSGLGKELSQ